MDWPKCEYTTQKARVRAEFATGQESDYEFEHVVCTGGKLIGEITGEDYGTCPACTGTGRAELTAELAEEFILANVVAAGFIPYDWVEVDICRSLKFDKGWKVKAVYGGNSSLYKIIGEGKNISAALQNAARTVCERKK